GITINGSMGGALPVSYTWNNLPPGQQANNLTAGSYQVTATDANQCTTVKTIVVQEPPPLTVDFTATQLVCSNDTNATIQAMIQGGVAPFDLQWNTGATTPDLNGLGPGNYVLMVTDRNGCLLTDSTRIRQPDSLIVQLQNTDPLCSGGTNGRLELQVLGGEFPYRYRLGNGTFGGSSAFFGLSAGNYLLQVRDGRGCTSALTAVLADPPAILVTLGMDTTIVLGQSVTLMPEINNAFWLTTNAWRSALLEDLVCVDPPDCADILVQPSFSNTYFLTVTDAHGCVGKASQQVHVEKPRGVYVPTGFTPNGDLENDRLIVHGKSSQVRNVRLFRVYDRWGELVFEDRDFQVNDLNRGWDGQFRGKNSDPGVYVWYLEAEYPDGYEEALKGQATLIR
ncbi:MAG: gliding motility-associated C-terminal domain-containing protein, partial [Saprospiraceae bacterium]